MLTIRGLLNLFALLAVFLILSYFWSVIKAVYALIKKECTPKEALSDTNVIAYFSELVKTEDEKTRKILNMSIACILIVGLPFFIISTFFPSTQIGNIFEKGEYTETYYVYLYPEGSESKNYKVKADIYVHSDSDEDNSYRYYTMLRAYFPNGGYIDIEDYGDSLQIGEKVGISDTQGRNWEAELTTERAN